MSSTGTSEEPHPAYALFRMNVPVDGVIVANGDSASDVKSTSGLFTPLGQVPAKVQAIFVGW